MSAFDRVLPVSTAVQFFVSTMLLNYVSTSAAFIWLGVVYAVVFAFAARERRKRRLHAAVSSCADDPAEES
ncbi:hypothetical protein GCM10009799_00800 [Nocardiopsis rhodophaea]|uniref:Uncharacterized protein n=1 Tax=Nocardiopsis rhodophaea TaxID=280238 RepID=A0ABN2S2Z3_9ACTN